MIKDGDVLKEVQDDWRFVRTRKDWITRGLFASSGIGGMPRIQIADCCNTLVLVFAYGVLQHVLEQLRDEGFFESDRSTLGALMSNSKKLLNWVDLNKVNDGRKKRNNVAHKEHAVLPRAECWKYVDAIDAELKAWGIMQQNQ